MIGLRIWNNRIKRNMTLRELANGIISVSHLSNIEKCNKKASVETLMYLSERLKIRERVLFVEHENTRLYLDKLKEISYLLFSECWVESKEKLNAFKESYVLDELPVEVEIGYYALLAVYLYKHKQIKEANDIARTYVENVFKIHLDNVDASCLSFYIQYKIQRSFMEGNYASVVSWCDKIFTYGTLDEVTQMNILLYKIACLMYNGQFEKSLTVAKKIQAIFHKYSPKYLEYSIACLYLVGCIYVEMNFFDTAKEYFQEVIHISGKDQQSTPHFVLLAKLKYEMIQKNHNCPKGQLYDTKEVYQFVISKTSNELTWRDYSIIAELILYYIDMKDLKQVKELKRLLEGAVSYRKYYKCIVHYANCIEALYEGNTGCYENSLCQLLKSDYMFQNTVFLRKVEKHASQYFAENLKYKKAYMLLSQKCI